MSGGNTRDGNYRTTIEATMRAFDKLPLSARRALADSVEDWATVPVITWHNRGRNGFVTGPDIAKAVARWDRKELRKREDQRARAIGPYKGNVPDLGAKPAPNRRVRG